MRSVPHVMPARHALLLTTLLLTNSFSRFFSIDRIAAKLSMDVKDLVAINKIEYKGLQHYSKLMPGTKLIVAYDGRMMVRFFFFSHKNISLVYMGT